MGKCQCRPDIKTTGFDSKDSTPFQQGRLDFGLTNRRLSERDTETWIEEQQKETYPIGKLNYFEETKSFPSPMPAQLEYRSDESIISQITKEAVEEFYMIAESQSWYISRSWPRKKKKRKPIKRVLEGQPRISFNPCRDRMIDLGSLCSTDEEIHNGSFLNTSRSLMDSDLIVTPSLDEYFSNI